MPQPPEVQQLAADLQEFADQAQQRLQALQDAILDEWPTAPRDARRQRLSELQHLAAEIKVNVDALAVEFVQTGLPAAYTLGAAVGNSLHQFNAVDFDAVNTLAQSTLDDMLAATTRVGRTTKMLVRTLTRQHLADKLLTGQTAEQAGRELRDALRGQGVSAITYKNGARQGLGAYTQMASRSVSAIAYNTGNINAATAAGVTYMECFDGFGCGLTSHTDGELANGLILPSEQARRYLISHPNCSRSWTPRPDVTNKREAKDAPRSQTPEQAADQQQVAQQREQAVANRARVKARQDRLAKRAEKLAARTGV